MRIQLEHSGMQAIKLLLSVVICFLPGFIGARINAKAIPEWYVYLRKPSFAPPNWVFAPAWTALYLLMAISLFLVWRKGLSAPGVKVALTVFVIQLLINGIWTPLFFGLRSPGAGLIAIIALWIAILFTIIRFLGVSRMAGLLLLPYLAWVSYASLLNFWIYRLNR